ncbi:hypothetical protein BDN71DRAFT_1431207 [Pleurotus eryngii]|uniref:Uncharacterized protein n=1 Tax=Pleurotus eryngii TaxID=5323 RepID=A0A9P5ZVK4_PLEER|nr:hypothetical protein BDN71DRAFT_1431207 [Pleurotus eryngii]
MARHLMALCVRPVLSAPSCGSHTQILTLPMPLNCCALEWAEASSLSGKELVMYERGDDDLRIAVGTIDNNVLAFTFDGRELHQVFARHMDHTTPIALHVIDNPAQDVWVIGVYNGGHLLKGKNGRDILASCNLGLVVGAAAFDTSHSLIAFDNSIKGYSLHALGDVMFGENGRIIVGGSENGVVYIFDRRTGLPLDLLWHSGNREGIALVGTIATHHDEQEGDNLICHQGLVKNTRQPTFVMMVLCCIDNNARYRPSGNHWCDVHLQREARRGDDKTGRYGWRVQSRPGASQLQATVCLSLRSVHSVTVSPAQRVVYMHHVTEVLQRRDGGVGDDVVWSHLMLMPWWSPASDFRICIQNGHVFTTVNTDHFPDFPPLEYLICPIDLSLGPEDTQQLSWVMNEYLQLICIPRDPMVYQGSLLEWLNYTSQSIPIIERWPGHFKLDDDLQKSWFELQKMFVNITTKLYSATPYPVIQEFYPMPDTFRYLREHTSFARGISEVLHKYSSPPGGALVDPTKVIFLNCILKFCQKPLGVTPYAAKPIPVWFYWGALPEELSAWRPPQTDVSMYCPTAQQLQQYLTPTSTLLPPPPPTIDLSCTPVPEQLTRQHHRETMQAFFKQEVQWAQKKETHKLDAEHSKRMDRVKAASKGLDPGKKGPWVFVWEKENGFDIQRHVGRREVSDIWSSYSESQRRYNSFRNEWDFCVDFDPAAIPDEEMDYEHDDDYDTSPTAPPPLFPAKLSNIPASSQLASSYEHLLEDPEYSVAEASESLAVPFKNILKSFLGFLSASPPVPLRAGTDLIQAKNVKGILGYSQVDITETVLQSLVPFVSALLAKPPYLHSSLDLHPQSISPIDLARLQPHVCHFSLGKDIGHRQFFRIGCITIEEKTNEDVNPPWHIVVEHAVIALFCSCFFPSSRENVDAYTVVHYFANHSIPFKTPVLCSVAYIGDVLAGPTEQATIWMRTAISDDEAYMDDALNEYELDLIVGNYKVSIECAANVNARSQSGGRPFVVAQALELEGHLPRYAYLDAER